MNQDLKEQLKKQIIEITRKNTSGITYSTLSVLEGFSGQCNLGHPDYPLIRFWEGLSEEAAEAIAELWRDGKIIHEPTDELAYMASGVTLEMPLFTTELAGQAGTLPQPHWLPVLIVPSPVR